MALLNSCSGSNENNPYKKTQFQTVKCSIHALEQGIS